VAVRSYPSPAERAGRVAERSEDGWGSEGRRALPNEYARALRKRLTPQETKLWVKLRGLKELGFHFRKQAPIGSYIVDFASFGQRLVIDVDGGQHGLDAGLRSDLNRDAFLQWRGFRVLRFWNSDVDRNSGGVVETILRNLDETPTPTG
jgi:very-short-patch-repair endonuclease